MRDETMDSLARFISDQISSGCQKQDVPGTLSSLFSYGLRIGGQCKVAEELWIPGSTQHPLAENTFFHTFQRGSGLPLRIIFSYFSASLLTWVFPHWSHCQRLLVPTYLL